MYPPKLTILTHTIKFSESINTNLKYDYMKYRLLLAFASLAFLVTGCVKENVSVCISNTLFKCSFVFNNDSTDQLSNLVNKIDLYIFDASGLLVRHISEVYDSLPENYSTAITLSSGTYTAVMYGTVSTNDGVVVGAKQGNLTTPLLPMQEGQSRMSDMRLMLNSINGQSDKDLQTVLHGMLSQFTVTSKSQTRTISFIRNTSTVEVSVGGLDNMIAEPTPTLLGSTRAESDIAVRIEGNNKAFLYDNTLDMELGRAIYAPYWQQFSSETLTAQLSVLRLFKEYPMTLKIYHLGSLMWQLNLTEEIMKSPEYSTNEDLDREDKFDIEVTVSAAGDFTISVNGWTTTTSGEIVG